MCKYINLIRKSKFVENKPTILKIQNNQTKCNFVGLIFVTHNEFKLVPQWY